MSYSTTSNEQTFTGDGANYTFSFTENTDLATKLQVRYVGSSGVPVALVNGTHYTLAGVGVTGGITITYPKGGASPTAPAPYNVYLTSSESLVAWVEPPLTQPLNPKWTAATSPATLEQILDDIKRTQQLHEAAIGRCYRGYVGTTIAAGTLPSVAAGSNRTLLDEETVAAAASLSVSSTNWPATYDRVELELLGCVPVGTASMVIQPIDNGSATGTNLVSNNVTYQSSPAATAHSNSSWAVDLTRTMGITDDDWLNGSATYSYYNAGFLSGIGQFTFRSGGNHYGTQMFMSRHTSALTRADGFTITTSSGNLSGTARLWGLPKT